MPFLPDAIRMPWNRAPATAAPNTTMLYPKSDSNWSSKTSAGVETLVGGPSLGAWAAYTPTWTATGTAPALGNGTLTGRFTQIGKTVMGYMDFVAGTTTTFGTGAWRFTFPVTSRTLTATQAGIGGTIYAEDAGLAGYMYTIRYVSTTTFEFVYSNDPGATAGQITGPAQNTLPFAWATGDLIRGYFFYEAA